MVSSDPAAGESRMVYENPKRVEARIRRLTRELDEIDDFFYSSDRNGDRMLYMSMLEYKRDDIVRSAVLQLHTSIEDLMTSMLFSWILGTAELRLVDAAVGSKRHGSRRDDAVEVDIIHDALLLSW
jgi:hypothetical protein